MSVVSSGHVDELLSLLIERLLIFVPLVLYNQPKRVFVALSFLQSSGSPLNCLVISPPAFNCHVKPIGPSKSVGFTPLEL
ncbi:hypothetical protein D3C78_1171980 [compost metagenome]